MGRKAPEGPGKKPGRAPRTPKRAPPPPPEPSGLTYKQRLFVAYYLGPANGNASEAARMAGYAKPGQQGHENLKKPEILAAVDAKLAGPALSADETLARLADMASADMGDLSPFFRVTVRNKVPFVEFDLAKAKAAGLSHLIKAVRPTRNGMTVELHDSLAALGKLARFHGLLAGGDRNGDDDARRRDARDSLARKLSDLAGRLGGGDGAAGPAE